VTTESDRRGALEALDRILNRGGDADDVLRAALALLGRLYPWAVIRFVDDGRLVPGPTAGDVPTELVAQSHKPSSLTTEISFQGVKVAELEAAAGEEDAAFLERFALLISPYCLVGWDTGGETWEP
jgi:hypothetical protein